MRTTAIIAAAILGITAGSIQVAPAQAASITITTGDGYRDGYRHDNGRHYGWRKGKHKGWRHANRHGFRNRDCVTRTVRYWDDGELVTEKRRTCRR